MSIEKIVAALEFYASAETYTTRAVGHDPVSYECPIGEDNGALAEEALRLAREWAAQKPVAFMWENLAKRGGNKVREIGFEAPGYIPSEKLTPLYAAPAPSDAADIAALRKDAERYQWLREYTSTPFADRLETLVGPTLDAAIDQARKEGDNG